MKKLGYLLFFAVVLVSCTPQDSNENYAVHQQNGIIGLAQPVQLNFDSTELFLTDFFLASEEVDSVVLPSGLTQYKSNKKNAIGLAGSLNQNIDVISFKYQQNWYDVPVKKSIKQKVTFAFSQNKSYQSVSISGSMNGWTPSKNPLKFKNNQWVTQFILNPGEYEYKLLADNELITDYTNPDSIDNGQGKFNSVFTVGNTQQQLPYMFTSTFNEGKITLQHQGVEGVLAFWQNTVLPQKNILVTNQTIEITLPENILNFDEAILRVYGFNSHALSNDIYIPFLNGKVIHNPKLLGRTNKHNFIMYFMMIDRFFNGDKTNDFPLNLPDVHPKADYYGGDMAGINQKIKDGYFNDLGVNTIWLSPITQNPLGPYGQYPNPKTKFSGYHGYWPISSSKVDFRFGDEQTFTSLIDNAHQNQINILVDYVANHVHQEHPVYKKHPDWATDLYLPDGTLNTEKWDEHRLTTWFDVFMPTLDFSKPEVIEAMTDSALFWFENFAIDGFRHDATKHIPEEFWRTLTYKLKKRVIEPNNRKIYQIGETYGNAELISSYVTSGQLDAQFDFNVYDAAVQAFAMPNVPITRLANKLKESLSYYGYHNLMGYISGNQDRARFISYADGSVSLNEDAKLAGWTRNITLKDTSAYKNLFMLHAFNLTIPGIPVIYYGDEIGMVGGNDPDNRKMMKFEDLTPHQAKLKSQVADLCKLRSTNLALQFGDLKFLHESEKMIVFCRKFFDSEVIVAFNKSNQAQNIQLSKPSFLNGNLYLNALNNQAFEFNKPIELPPLSASVFTKN